MPPESTGYVRNCPAEPRPDWLGAHMSMAGGLHLAFERGIKAGCGVIQIFTQNANQWRGRMPTETDARMFREARAESGINAVLSHDIYLINLAAAPGEVREKSLAAFHEEMARCARLGIDRIVMHPGAHLGDGTERGIERIIGALDRLLDATPEFSGKILLETTAGQGTSLGHRFEQLAAIISGCRSANRLGVCFDTCHAFAAGYDLSTTDGYAATFTEFDRILGLDRLLAFHLNDSKKGLGCRVDRHEHIGLGAIGLTGFQLLMNDPRFATTPKILETPKGDDGAMDRVNLGILRGLTTQRRQE